MNYIQKFLLLFLILFVEDVFAQQNIKKVFISQVTDHKALNATASGIIDALAQSGYKKGSNLIVQIESAQGLPGMAAQIAAKFIEQNPDVVVGLGTISSQSFLKYISPSYHGNKKVNLVFSSVTDPLEAGLLQSLDSPHNNVSGVSNFIDLKPQIELFLKLQPKLKTLGILYNPGELNSLVILRSLEALCEAMQIKLVKHVIFKTADVAQATMRLINSVDAIFISNDNTALSAFSLIANVANTQNIPVYVSDNDFVEYGALAGLGPNQYQIGIQTGKMIAKILDGAYIGNIPIEFPDTTELYINEYVAKKLNISIPQEIMQNAVLVQQKDSSS